MIEPYPLEIRQIELIRYEARRDVLRELRVALHGRERARAAALLASDRPEEEKVAAIEQIAATGARDTLGLLTPLLSSESEAIRAAAEAGISHVNGSLALWDAAQNIWYGISLGSVLLLAAIGIYGVTSYAVSRRTREIGIRIALGADRRAVMSMVLRQGLGLAAVGIAIGLALAAAGSGLLQRLLFGISGLDPLTFAGACLLFPAITRAASYLPARRARAVDAMAALRND